MSARARAEALDDTLDEDETGGLELRWVGVGARQEGAVAHAARLLEEMRRGPCGVRDSAHAA